ncbi:PSD1 and planctomycete cytochrome C domain-containing protein [Neorhodopirellula pilleata]|uniref:Planctomycete cytochrome C n=1 Tax=Neorhodopirellula pilleata TaxID=2714738 RepID=A0A5C6AKJ5_9BACT|nr:PSD1 and planctomycete cytochrome C domain-containing protein [Neorhodopirellula pilleata]TWT98693.1 Planctomycete cytochrome C [Neorhodopirellula pilleata]
MSISTGLLSRFTVVLVSFAGFAFGDDIEFNRDVRPILSNHCFTCHGPDSATREGGLRLDQRDAATGMGDSGELAIVPGSSSVSEIIRRVTSTDPDVRMPPVDGPEPLSPQQISTLKTWIDQGAPFQSHWAFVTVAQPTVPETVGSDWPHNDIDRFVLDKLLETESTPAPEATRETLIRRVAFDLTGLPPTVDEIDEFLADRSDRAYENMVDRFLKSPAYGEHMARHWLDLARYADTNGYQYDTEREQWVWRDWVINAYNENMPFDQFTIEQLAGDLLPDATVQQRLATGFNRNHGITIEGGIIDEEYRTEYVMDRVTTTGAVWMGMTIGCARCHDHKYDPISQREFYQLYSFFNQVPERGMNGFAPSEKIPSPLAIELQQSFESKLGELRAELNEPLNLESSLDEWVDQLAASPVGRWSVLIPKTLKSSGGSTLTQLDDHSILAGETNPQQDIYDIGTDTDAVAITAVRLEALTHESLPGGGPGRHSNSNFVLSEFELTAVSMVDDSKTQVVKFVRAISDYEQANYAVAKAINGTVANNDGWAVDGPTRKKPATAVFVAESPFGFPGGTELRFRLRHEAGFATHGIGRARLSVTTDQESNLRLHGIPAEILRIAATKKQDRSVEDANQLRDYFLAHHDPREDLKKRIAEVEQQQANAFPATMIMQEMPQPRTTRVLNRGQYNEPTDEVTANVPAVFPALPKNAPANRLGFAQWLVDRSHPLTARVAVNRYWQRLFGTGLVKTSEDFGVQGSLPSHPELLDWLATVFVDSGWDVKYIQRLMITSATYRQTSHVGAAAYQADPENRWLARGPRMRLDGEEIRDAALLSSGLLVNRLGGKSVYPYQPAGLWMELNNRPGYSKEYPQGSGDDLYRRSLYTFWKRTVPSPMLKILDAPEREFCTIRRSRTNTPSQALVLLNSPQFVEAARHLGERMMKHKASSLEDKLAYGFRLVTAREPNELELATIVEAFESEQLKLASSPEMALKILQVGESEFDSTLDQSQLAAFASIASLYLNLNEAITKG